MQGFEPRALVLDRVPVGAPAIGSSGSTTTSPSRSDHVATTRPSTRTVPTENGFFEVKITGRCASGRRPVRRA